MARTRRPAVRPPRDRERAGTDDVIDCALPGPALSGCIAPSTQLTGPAAPAPPAAHRPRPLPPRAIRTNRRMRRSRWCYRPATTEVEQLADQGKQLPDGSSSTMPSTNPPRTRPDAACRCLLGVDQPVQPLRQRAGTSGSVRDGAGHLGILPAARRRTQPHFTVASVCRCEPSARFWRPACVALGGAIRGRFPAAGRGNAMEPDLRIRAAIEEHWRASEAEENAAEHAIYAEDAVLEYPQSGERFRPRDDVGNGGTPPTGASPSCGSPAAGICG